MANILTQTYIPAAEYGFGDFTDIDSSLVGTIGGISFQGLTEVAGGVIFLVQVSAEDTCFFFINTPVTDTGTLPCADLGVAYSQNLAAADTETTSYVLVAGTLPPGLTLSSVGLLAGTPEPFRFTIQITDDSGATATSKDFAMLYCCATETPTNSDNSITTQPVTWFFRATNLTMIRGDSFRFQSTVYMNGEIVDLTGAAVRLTAKYAVTDSDTDAVFSKYTPFNGISLTDPTNGLITVTLDPADTASLPYHSINLVYDIQLYYPVLEVYTFQSGILTVLPEISRAVN